MGLLLLLLLLAACGRSPQAQLRQADALMETHPDSAMVLLNALDRADFSAADSAYFALLFTQAQIKTDVYLTSDSLIARALDAYRFSTDPDLRRRAHFYAAQVAYRQRNYRDAMRNAVVAYDIALDSADPYWTAKTAELLSDLYTHAFNYDLAQRFTRIAAEKYLKAGRERNHRFSLCDLATNYAARGYGNSAFALVDSVILVAQTSNPPDSTLCYYGNEVRTKIRWLMDDYAGLDKSMQTARKEGVDHTNRLIYSIIASCGASEAGDSVAFSDYIESAYSLVENNQDLVPVLYAEYCNAVANRDYDKSLSLADSIIRLQCAVADELLDESLTSIQSDYYASQNMLKKQKNASLRQLILVIFISAVIAIVLIVTIFKQRLRFVRAEISCNLANIQALKAKSNDNAQLIESMFANKWDIVNKLCNVYHDMGNSREMQKFIVRDIEAELQSLGTPESIRDILNLTDKCKNGVITRIRRECPFLKEQDIEFLGLIYSGLSVRAVCYFSKIKKDSFYKKKNRLMRRIAESSAPNKTDFLCLLSQYSI